MRVRFFANKILSLHSNFFIGEDSVAQLVEHNTFNVGVLGSNPSGITDGREVN